MANTIKLETNVPVTGVVKQVWYQKSTKPDWSDQIKLVGAWDGRGDGNIYVHTALESQMQQKGIMGARGGDSYPVLGQSVRVQLLKKEEGGKKFVDITLLSGGGGAPQQPSGTSNNQQSSPQTATANRIEPKLHWQKLQLTMKSCIDTAKTIAGTEAHAVAVALFEERCRHGLLSSPPAALADQAAKDAIAQTCIKLGQDENFLKAELLKQGVTDIAKMTEPEGKKVQAALDALVAAKEAADKAAGEQHSMFNKAEDIPF